MSVVGEWDANGTVVVSTNYLILLFVFFGTIIGSIDSIPSNFL